MTNFFFEKYRPEICCGLHKWCCEQILRHLRLFRGKKKFFLKTCFFDFFCISGVTDFLKNDQLLFWEIPAWNLSNKFHKWCCEQILRHLRLFRAKKFFPKIWNFLTFFAYPGSQISWKMTNVFFERYRPEICRGLHKWCCERILRRFGSFRARKKFFEGSQFFDFFCISGVTDFLKNDQLFFWEIPGWNFSWTAQMVLRMNHKAFWLVSSEKNFFQKFEIFWLFLHIRGHRFLEKWPTSFLRDTGLKFVVDCTNGVANKF